MRVCEYVHMYGVYVSVRVSMYAWEYVCKRHVCPYMCIRISECIHVCGHICVCVCECVYTHVYIAYTCVQYDLHM